METCITDPATGKLLNSQIPVFYWILGIILIIIVICIIMSLFLNKRVREARYRTSGKSMEFTDSYSYYESEYYSEQKTQVL